MRLSTKRQLASAAFCCAPWHEINSECISDSSLNLEIQLRLLISVNSGSTCFTWVSIESLRFGKDDSFVSESSLCRTAGEVQRSWTSFAFAVMSSRLGNFNTEHVGCSCSKQISQFSQALKGESMSITSIVFSFYAGLKSLLFIRRLWPSMLFLRSFRFLPLSSMGRDG